MANLPSIVAPRISVIITVHNEGEELHRTLRSVTENTRGLVEIIVVDDGSQDSSCDGIASEKIRVIRHESRIGVAYSRDEASRAAHGDVFCYLDGHQRVNPECLDRCARTALESNAITCPDVRNYGLFGWRLYGANFKLCPKHGFFTCDWRQWRIRRRISPVTGLRAPPYCIPKTHYSRVAWSESLKGWGASEASVGVRSFFSGVPILHVGGPLSLHRFRRRFSYETTWDGIWRNHAIIARVCFDERTWKRYWLPRVFEAHLTEAARNDLKSDAVQAEHETFQALKVRSDRQFWTDLLQQRPPEEL
jgi:glycosyltransferase involved in cell wall biosynthesis